jgi:hypothetical protein
VVRNGDFEAGSREGAEVEYYWCWMLEMKGRLSACICAVVGVCGKGLIYRYEGIGYIKEEHHVDDDAFGSDNNIVNR